MPRSMNTYDTDTIRNQVLSFDPLLEVQETQQQRQQVKDAQREYVSRSTAEQPGADSGESGGAIIDNPMLSAIRAALRDR